MAFSVRKAALNEILKINNCNRKAASTSPQYRRRIALNGRFKTLALIHPAANPPNIPTTKIIY